MNFLINKIKNGDHGTSSCHDPRFLFCRFFLFVLPIQYQADYHQNNSKCQADFVAYLHHNLPAFTQHHTDKQNQSCPRQRTQEGIDKKFLHIHMGKASWQGIKVRTTGSIRLKNTALIPYLSNQFWAISTWDF